MVRYWKELWRPEDHSKNYWTATRAMYNSIGKPSDLSFGRSDSSRWGNAIAPHIHRESTEEDTVRYQTVYSQVKVRVAAPTAGLHLPRRSWINPGQRQDHRLCCLARRAGTFKPIKTENALDHTMHSGANRY